MNFKKALSLFLMVALLFLSGCSNGVAEREKTSGKNEGVKTASASSDDANNKAQPTAKTTVKYKMDLKTDVKREVEGISFYTPVVAKESSKKIKTKKYSGEVYFYKPGKIVGGYAVYDYNDDNPGHNITYQYEREESIKSINNYVVCKILSDEIHSKKGFKISESYSKTEKLKGINKFALRYTGFIFTKELGGKKDDSYIYYYSENIELKKNKVLIIWVSDITSDNSMNPEIKKILISMYLKNRLEK